MPRKLPWPASKIDRDVLHELWCEAKKTGQPITIIVQQAVNDYLNAKLQKSAPDAAHHRDAAA